MNRNTLMKQLVIEEATNLKKNAKKSELRNLNFNNLDSSHVNHCIYGQMTGYCNSERSIDLMKKCASRVYKTETAIAPIYTSKVNGSPKNLSRIDFWSPIEVFIDNPVNKKNGNNELLVKFLKGEINKLNFK